MSNSCSPKPSHQGELSPGCKSSASAVQAGSQSLRMKGGMWPPFPPRDLLQTLVDIYFARVNLIWPLLHRPSFEADLLKSRHKRDLPFARVVLATCAVASRYCVDGRVLAKVRIATPDIHCVSSDTASNYPWDGPYPWIDDLEQDYARDPLFTPAPLYSAGWKYFDRMQRCQTATMRNIDIALCDLQTAHVSEKSWSPSFAH